MLNKARIISFNLWDAETGEADVIAEFNSGKKLKAFSLDIFDEKQTYDVILSLFCHDYIITDEYLDSQIKNVGSNYQVELQGKIISSQSKEDEGDMLVIDVDNIFICAYLSSEEYQSSPKRSYFKGKGRLDIEIPSV